MPYTTAPSHDGPMKDLNITPFIDVLLVLLVLLIMTVPIMTNVTEVELPNGDGGLEPDPVINVVGLTAGDQMLWNGQPVDKPTLESSIARALALPTEPVLRFSPDPAASYNASAKTILVIKDSGSKKFAFDRLHEHRTFARAR